MISWFLGAWSSQTWTAGQVRIFIGSHHFDLFAITRIGLFLRAFRTASRLLRKALLELTFFQQNPNLEVFVELHCVLQSVSAVIGPLPLLVHPAVQDGKEWCTVQGSMNCANFRIIP